MLFAAVRGGYFCTPAKPNLCFIPLRKPFRYSGRVKDAETILVSAKAVGSECTTMVLKRQPTMHICQTGSAEKLKGPQAWSPICCGRDMYQLIRRMIVGSDGNITFCGVWNCTVCGRLLL